MQKALGFVFALCLAICGPAGAQQAAQSPALAQANALFDEYWEWTLLESPEFATYFGDRRYQDRLRDESAAAVARRKAFYAEFRSRLAGIDAAAAPGADPHVAAGAALPPRSVRRAQQALRRAAFRHLRRVGTGHANGRHSSGLADLASIARFDTVSDYEAYLKRLGAVPASIVDLIARMEAAMAAGWMPAKAAIRNVPKQLDAQLPDDATQSPEYKPFKSFPADIAAAERQRLADAGRERHPRQGHPGLPVAEGFYEGRYLPAARDSSRASDLPPGMPYYQAMLDWNTTTDLTPQTDPRDGPARGGAHPRADGCASVAATGFKGTLAEFQKFLSTDPRFFFTRARGPAGRLPRHRQARRRGAAEALRRAAAHALRHPRDGAVRRRQRRPLLARRASTAAAPGFFEANVNNLDEAAHVEMETTLLHEAVPGHHLQIARAQELKGLPQFRRAGWFSAYGEGWALYAESLGYEMGFYKDPYQHFGSLSAEMLRACRLVIDTGIHAKGWTREQPIDYLVDEHRRTTSSSSTAEVDRYIVWPGQALGLQDRRAARSRRCAPRPRPRSASASTCAASTTRCSTTAPCRCRCSNRRSTPGSRPRRQGRGGFLGSR